MDNMYKQIKELAEDSRGFLGDFIKYSTVFLAFSVPYIAGGCTTTEISASGENIEEIEVYKIEYQQEGETTEYDVSFKYRENVPLSSLPEKFMEEFEREGREYLAEEEEDLGDLEENVNYMEASISGGEIPPGGINLTVVDIYGANDIGGLEEKEHSGGHSHIFKELEASKDEPDLVHLESGVLVGLSEVFTKDDIGSEVELETYLKDIPVSEEKTEKLGRLAEEKYREVRKKIHQHLREGEDGEKYRPEAVELKDRLMDILGL